MESCTLTVGVLMGLPMTLSLVSYMVTLQKGSERPEKKDSGIRTLFRGVSVAPYHSCCVRRGCGRCQLRWKEKVNMSRTTNK